MQSPTKWPLGGGGEPPGTTTRHHVARPQDEVAPIGPKPWNMDEKITEISGLPLAAETGFGGFDAVTDDLATTYSFDRPSIHAKDVPLALTLPPGGQTTSITTPSRGASEAGVKTAAGPPPKKTKPTPPNGKPPQTGKKPTALAPVEPAPEAEPSAAVRAELSKLSPKPRKSCRECRQSPATVKGDRTFVECTVATCSAGFAGYQADLYHAPGKFCSHCLVRRYAYPPEAINPATFKCPVCTDAKVCSADADAAAGSSMSKASARRGGTGGRATAPAPRGQNRRKGPSGGGGGGSGSRKRARVRPAKRRQATPMTPLLSPGVSVVTAEGLFGVIIGSGNGFFDVRLTGDESSGKDSKVAGDAQASPIVVKRRGTVLQLRTKQPRSEQPERDGNGGDGGEDDDEEETEHVPDSSAGEADPDGMAAESEASAGVGSDDAAAAAAGGAAAASASVAASVAGSSAEERRRERQSAREREELESYTGGLRAVDVLRYVSAQHPHVLQEAVEAIVAAGGGDGGATLVPTPF